MSAFLDAALAELAAAKRALTESYDNSVPSYFDLSPTEQANVGGFPGGNTAYRNMARIAAAEIEVGRRQRLDAEGRS